MSTGVQITLIICVTLIALIYILAKHGSDINNNKKK
jgi:hypothetical protein